MKTIVVNESDNTRVPFLRGILIRSLLDAGLPFKAAFGIATQTRELLADQKIVATALVRNHVVELLRRGGHQEALENYQQPMAAPSRILIRGISGDTQAFSRRNHQRYLQASGMKAENAEDSTSMIFDQLLAAGVESMSSCQLGFLTYRYLLQEVSAKAADRYLVWLQFKRSSRPLLVLICGTVGSGKSTIATELAHILDIVRIQSTDMLREVMRMMTPERLLPILHKSSFNAWEALPIQDVEQRDRDQLIADGYRSQADLLAIPCEAVLHRAIEESVPMILEGVHAHPDLLQQMPEDSEAIIVHAMLAVLKPKALKRRLKGRGSEVPLRRAKRYLKTFDAIWSLQSFLLSEGDRCDVPIITNQDKDRAAQLIILHIIDSLAARFTAGPPEVFRNVPAAADGAFDDWPWQQLVQVIGQ